jgi:hypothetical protein
MNQLINKLSKNKLDRLKTRKKVISKEKIIKKRTLKLMRSWKKLNPQSKNN